jgi:hypothetical protein
MYTIVLTIDERLALYLNIKRKKKDFLKEHQIDRE